MPTVKHLSYAGITLPLPTPELERSWLARIHPPYDFTDFDGFNFDKPTALGVPTPPVPRPTDFKLNTLFWPSSASRPAWFHAVVESSRLDALRTAVGVNSALAPLVFYDGRSGKTVTAQMRMLPERPFNITVGENTETFWLVTLTDNRYFWYLKRGVITAPASWTNLFSQIGTILGVSITVDTVNAGYGVPSSKWATSYRTPGSLLDAAAYSVGQRVVVRLDGSVRTVNWETAQSASDAYFATADAPVSGGRVSATGIIRCAPSSVNTVFGTTPGGGTHVVNNTLASLVVSGYGAATGIAGYADTVFGDGTYTGANGAALATYAAAAATDLYGWRLSDPDVAWPGIEPWVPTGWEERVEWTMKVRDDGPFALTTVRRGPWMEFVAGDYLNDPDSAPTLTVEEEDGTPSVPNVIILQFAESDGFVVSTPIAGTALINLTGTPIDLTVREVDGTPSVNPVNTIEFLQSSGLVVTDQGAGVARVAFVPAATYFGCGLDVVGGVVVLDLTDVAQDGLYWDNDLCVLGINFDPCNFTLVGDVFTLDLANLVGDAEDTSMVTGPGCSIAFDRAIVTTVPITYVTNFTAAIVGTVLTIDKTRQTITDRYNAAGVLVDRVYGTPSTTLELEYDLCETCCPCADDGEQLYTASGDYTFTATCSGRHTIEANGPGGTGTGQNGDDAVSQAGGGGGAYAWAEVCLEEGVEYAVHVGAGGGQDDTTFDITVVAAAGNNAVGAVAGAGGLAADSLGDIVFSGGNGAVGAGVNGGGGGGGGGAGATGVGTNGTAAAGGTGGAGGSGNTPGGNGGAGGNNGAVGTNGSTFGGGGGGSGFHGVTAGTGAGGRVKITW